jgi:hypothetical protein
VAGKSVGESGNASPMGNGDYNIPITFEACTSSKSKPTERGLSTSNSTARKTPSTFGAMPPSSKNPELAGGTRMLNL